MEEEVLPSLHAQHNGFGTSLGEDTQRPVKVANNHHLGEEENKEHNPAEHTTDTKLPELAEVQLQAEGKQERKEESGSKSTKPHEEEEDGEREEDPHQDEDEHQEEKQHEIAGSGNEKENEKSHDDGGEGNDEREEEEGAEDEDEQAPNEQNGDAENENTKSGGWDATKATPGTVVWAKLTGYPLWPARVNHISLLLLLSNFSFRRWPSLRRLQRRC